MGYAAIYKALIPPIKRPGDLRLARRVVEGAFWSSSSRLPATPTLRCFHMPMSTADVQALLSALGPVLHVRWSVIEGGCFLFSPPSTAFQWIFASLQSLRASEGHRAQSKRVAMNVVGQQLPACATSCLTPAVPHQRPSQNRRTEWRRPRLTFRLFTLRTGRVSHRADDIYTGS